MLKHPLSISALALLLLPYFCVAIGFTYGIATEIALFAMVTLGFNLLLGYTGLLSFGHGLFFGFAAYAAALAQIHWFQGDMLLPVVFAVGATAVLGGAVGFLVLRRRGVYFSLLTLAFTALGFYIAYRWTDFTGGESGLRGVRRTVLLGIDLDNQLAFYYFCAAIVFAITWIMLRVVRSPFGSVLVAIRENEQRAGFAGYPVRRYKLAAFILSATVTGLGGALFTFLKLFASADPLHPNFSGEILAMSIIGGSGSFMGPPLGAAFYALFREILSGYTASWMFWFGLLFMAFILFSPSGLIGLGKRLLAPWRKEAETLAAMASRVKPNPSQEMPSSLLQAKPPEREAVLLSAEHVSKSFGDFKAVNDVSISLRHARLHALIGPNGAGKTTLFNLLSGMYVPETGSLNFAGQAIKGRSSHRFAALGIARSFQITNLFQGLSVFENLRLECRRRFSNTLSPWNRLVIWNERAMPSAAKRWELRPLIACPAKFKLPVSGTYMPERRLNRVVLPAPLGPISACSRACRRLMLTSFTALKSPKLLLTFSAESSTASLSGGLACSKLEGISCDGLGFTRDAIAASVSASLRQGASRRFPSPIKPEGENRINAMNSSPNQNIQLAV